MQNVTPEAIPYRGIHPYRYADKDLFFGRDQIIEELTVNVLLYRLVVLFGDSGAGKSSVINAGIIPTLEKKGFHSERLRVSPAYENSPFLIERIKAGGADNSDFLPSIFVHNSAKIPKANERVPCSIEHFLSTIREEPRETNLLLIFDQFEELFTLFSAKQTGTGTYQQLAQNQILNTIYEIVSDQQLKVKVLIIIREDFWGKLEVLSKRYPKIFDHYVRLRYLNQEDAKKAILGPFENYDYFPSKLTEDLADTIVRELAAEDLHAEVHATQLQIVCDQLWQQYANYRPEITNHEFDAAGGVKGIIEGYLTSALAKLDSFHKAQAIQVLGNLITDSDTRDIVSKDKLKDVLNFKDEKQLDKTLDSLDRLRIINRTQQRDNFYFEIASEYLVDPIKKETQRLLTDRKWKQLRRRWSLALGLVILVLSTPTIWAYTIWKENQPWGYMTDLSTLTLHPLKGALVSIGRSTQGFTNQINLPFKLISRMHLFISHDLEAIDVRSLNGTTINAHPLVYGEIKKLSEGDLIVLAGVAPFQFSQTSIPQQPPPSGWGILIDGQSKTAHSLSASQHVLSLNAQGKLVVGDAQTTDPFLTIAYTNGQIAITGKQTDRDLWTTMRLGDYTYVRCKVPPRQLFTYFDIEKLYSPGTCEILSGRRDLNDITQPIHDISTVTYSYGDVSFQIVPIPSGPASIASAH